MYKMLGWICISPYPAKKVRYSPYSYTMRFQETSTYMSRFNYDFNLLVVSYFYFYFYFFVIKFIDEKKIIN